MKTLKRYIGIYIHFLKLNMKTMLEYKADFLIAFATSIPIQIVQLMFIWVIFENISNLQGWTFYEMALIYGIMICSTGVADTFFDAVYEMPKDYIRKGTFDNIVVQPVNSLFNIISRKFYTAGLSNFIIGTGIIVMSISNLDVNFGVIQWLLLVFFIICGGLIFGGLMTIATTSTFWVVESIDIIWDIYTMHEFALYPIELYNGFIKGLITVVLPYAFASYYPATYFLGKSNGNIVWFSPLVVITIWFIAMKLWKIGMKKYGSTGS